MDFLWFLIIGLIAGWLAGQIMRGGGYGIAGDIVVGIIGSLIGGFLFRLLGFTAYGTLGAIVVAAIGAIVFIASMRTMHRLSDTSPSYDD
jgi:uncharacterized membrane protein YeaQ/YmgE (transglycosylase-associated protein family)